MLTMISKLFCPAQMQNFKSSTEKTIIFKLFFLILEGSHFVLNLNEICMNSQRYKGQLTSLICVFKTHSLNI